MVFLHEGLGSIALWKTFPDLLCRRLKMRGLVYSRPGYGQSTPRAKDERWDADFMHRQAFDILPALLSQLNIDQPWLFGHSDGGSISLLFASHYSERCAGLIVVAPHIMVEDISITSILLARDAYLHQGLRERLARYHDDVDSAFFGWNDVWLSPAFRHWSIQADLKNIRCPLLAVQGEDDEYGTMEQVYGIQRILPHAVVIPVADCGHSPHRDQPQLLTEAVVQFVSAYRTTC
jgi:pimeloyl-ACP methyl ester carboxylesterase